MDVTTRANPLNNLLTNVAALRKVQGAVLARLQWKFAQANVCTEPRNTLEDEVPFKRVGTDRLCCGGDEGNPEHRDVVGRQPNLVILNCFAHATYHGEPDSLPGGIKDLSG